MDNIRRKIERHQKLLSEYVRSLAKKYNEALGSTKDYFAVVDSEDNHFQFLRMGWREDHFSFTVLIHFYINPNTGNIWIQQNNTEIQLDVELKEQGDVPNDNLVLGFRPEFMREYSKFAIA